MGAVQVYFWRKLPVAGIYASTIDDSYRYIPFTHTSSSCIQFRLLVHTKRCLPLPSKRAQNFLPPLHLPHSHLQSSAIKIKFIFEPQHFLPDFQSFTTNEKACTTTSLPHTLSLQVAHGQLPTACIAHLMERHVRAHLFSRAGVCPSSVPGEEKQHVGGAHPEVSSHSPLPQPLISNRAVDHNLQMMTTTLNCLLFPTESTMKKFRLFGISPPAAFAGGITDGDLLLASIFVLTEDCRQLDCAGLSLRTLRVFGSSN